MRTKRPALALLASLTLWAAWPAAAFAQENAAQPEITPEVRAEGRRLQAEAQAHVEAQRWALAAQSYQELYEFSRAHGAPQAPIALWNVGLALIHVPGRERDAREAFQRFLDESTTLTDDPQVRDWRSTAVEHIAELEARIGPEDTHVGPQHEGDGGQPHGRDGSAASTSDDAPPTATGVGEVSPLGPVALGFGAIAVLTGVIIGGVVLVDDDGLTAMCSAGRCPESAHATANEVERLALTADILVIAGAAIAATGLVLTLALREEAPPATVAAGCGPQGCAVRLQGRF